MKHWVKNTVIVGALLGAGFALAWIRFRPYLEDHGHYTDGRSTTLLTEVERLRYAVWDPADLVAGEVNGPTSETRTTMSPDGRYLVFASGERGVDADLYIADLDGERAQRVRPLATLNSPFDEVAPRFGDDALYFASNRPGGAGGLDLWRCDFAAGTFGEAVRLAGSINSEADETDPAPLPRSRAVANDGSARETLLFVTTRHDPKRRDHDLVRAVPTQDWSGALDWLVEPLQSLNTPFDEREPALSAHGAALYFASDRGAGRGSDDFDLYQCVRLADGTTTPPVPIESLNTAASERAPDPSADGFALRFSRDLGAGSAGEILLARSRELFRTQGEPIGWRELLLVLLLLLLALLAWAAKHWRAMDIIYRCFVVSLILHLLLLLWFREVHPESDVTELARNGPRVRVQLSEPTAAREARRAFGGELVATRSDASAEAPEHSSESPAAQPATVPASARLERAAAELVVSASERALADAAERTPDSAAAAAADIAQPAESFEKRGLAAAEVALPDASSSGARAPTGAAEPERGAAAPSEPSQTRATELAASVLPLPRESDAGPQQPERADVAGSRTSTSAARTNAVATARPAIEGERRTAQAQPALDVAALAASESAFERGLGSSGATRDTSELEFTAGADVAAPAALALAPLAADAAEPGRAPELAGAAQATAPSSARDVALERSAATEPSRAALPSESVPLVAQAQGFARESKPATGLAAPQRFERTGATPTTGPVAPSFEAIAPEANAAPLPQAAELVAASRPEAEAPRAVDVTRPELGAAREAGGTASAAGTELAAAPASFERRASAPSGPKSAAPKRADAAQASPSATAPAPLALAAAAPPAPDEPAHHGRDLESTPYRSRSGAAKLAALATFGGNVQTEAAVANGLAYLASIQRSNGSWGDPRFSSPKYGETSIGKTGLAVLAFLGAGHTPGSATEYSRNVERALAHLVAQQDPRSGHFGRTSSYSHSIATYALAEAYALENDARWRSAIERAVVHILEMQVQGGGVRRNGGWGYYTASGPQASTNDGERLDDYPRTSITAWQVMALESARLGGLAVPDSAFDLAREFLLGAWDEQLGAFRYSHEPSRLRSGWPTLPGSTPAAMFALSLLGEDLTSRRYDDARAYLAEREQTDFRYTSDDAFVLEGQGNLYFVYYATLASFRIGGEPWSEWNAALQELLLGSQRVDGSWRPISSYALEHAGDSDDDSAYTTAMAVLSLEVYYRYFTPLLSVRTGGGPATEATGAATPRDSR